MLWAQVSTEGPQGVKKETRISESWTKKKHGLNMNRKCREELEASIVCSLMQRGATRGACVQQPGIAFKRLGSPGIDEQDRRLRTELTEDLDRGGRVNERDRRRVKPRAR
jgi:hypothetical protein